MISTGFLRDPVHQHQSHVTPCPVISWPVGARVRRERGERQQPQYPRRCASSISRDGRADRHQRRPIASTGSRRRLLCSTRASAREVVAVFRFRLGSRSSRWDGRDVHHEPAVVGWCPFEIGEERDIRREWARPRWRRTRCGGCCPDRRASSMRGNGPQRRIDMFEAADLDGHVERSLPVNVPTRKWATMSSDREEAGRVRLRCPILAPAGRRARRAGTLVRRAGPDRERHVFPGCSRTSRPSYPLISSAGSPAW